MRALSFEEQFLRLNIDDWASDDFDVDMDSNQSWPSGSTWSLYKFGNLQVKMLIDLG